MSLKLIMAVQDLIYGEFSKKMIYQSDSSHLLNYKADKKKIREGRQIIEMEEKKLYSQHRPIDEGIARLVAQIGAARGGVEAAENSIWMGTQLI